MKMILISALVATAFVTNAETTNTFSSATLFKFQAVDNSSATNYCIVAATEGLKAVKRLAKNKQENFFELKSRISCNGYSLAEFSEKYSLSEQSDQELESSQPTLYKIHAHDDAKESKICVDALVLGEKAAREKYEIPRASILCNDKSLKAFVAEYKDKDLDVQITSTTSNAE